MALLLMEATMFLQVGFGFFGGKGDVTLLFVQAVLELVPTAADISLASVW